MRELTFCALLQRTSYGDTLHILKVFSLFRVTTRKTPRVQKLAIFTSGCVPEISNYIDVTYLCANH